ncbi:hypothetical protein [Gracilibacillus kekensis]|nr:hypothetical protein [Gracilibacillus kekensis]
MKIELQLCALRMAIIARQLEASLIHHSDENKHESDRHYVNN